MERICRYICLLCVCFMALQMQANRRKVMQMSIGKDFDRKVSTMNISNLSGEYYVSLRIVPAAAGIRGQIFSIYLT